MNKTILIFLTSTFTLTTGLNQINTILPNKKILESDWVQENVSNTNIKFKKYLYNDKKIAINLIKNHLNQTIAQIYGKKAQKNIIYL